MNQARYRNQLVLAVAAFLLLKTVSGNLSAQDITLKGHSGAVLMAAFAAEDGRVVTASSDQTAKLWDAVTGEELQSFKQHTGPLYCLAVSADGRTLVTGAQDNTLRVWDLPLSHPIRRVTAPGAAVMEFVFSPDGTLLLAGSADHSVRLIDLSTHTTAAASPAPVLPAALLRVGHTSDVLATAYRNDGTSFATADATGHIMVWSPDLDQQLARLQAHPGKVTAIVLPNNDQRLASAGDDGIIRVWQLPTPSPKKLAASDVAGGTIAVLPGQQVAVYALANGLCRLINLLTGEVQREFPQPEGETTQIAVSPTSAWFGRANTAGRMQVINVNDASIIGSVAGHEGAIKDVAVCLDGLRFVTAGADGTMRLWKQPLAAVPMPGHSGIVRSLAAARNGLWSLTISDDMTTRRWNAAGALVAQYGNHTQPLRSVMIRDDDTLFATGDAEGTVWVWDAATGTAQGVVRAHSVAVSALEFSADRGSLITATADGTIRSWTLPLPAQKPADGTEPVKPAWEYKSADGAGILQLARLSQEQGLAALTAVGTSIVRLRWDGSAADPIASPGGVLKRLDVAANGSAFLATSDAGQIHVFEINGLLRKSLAPIAGLTSARFDRDGAFVAVCRTQPFVQIVNGVTGLVHEELATGIPVIDAGWTGQDQRSLVCLGAGNDSVLVQSALLKHWGGIKDGATAVTLSPDQQFAFCGGSDGTIRQWNLTDANPANIEPVKTYAGHAAPVTELSVSPNGAILCSVSDDKTLRVWKIADRSIVHTIEHPKAVTSVSVSPDSTRVVTGCADGIPRLWDVTTGQLLESFADHTADTAIQCVRYLSDSQTIVSSGDDKSLITRRTTVSRSVAVHTGAIRSMVAYNGGVQVISAGDDAKVVMTNLSTGNRDREYTVGDQKPVVVAVRPDAQQIAAGCEAGEVLVWNVNDGTKTLQVLNVNSAVTSMAWSPDNRKLAVSTARNTIHIFAPTVQGVQPPVELTLHQQFAVTSPVNRLVFAADSRSVWTALADGQIEEWAYAGLEQRRQFNHGGPVYGVAVTHDGSTVVSCSTDQTVRVWDTLAGQQKFQLNGHDGAVHAVALSPDETFAVSSGADGTLRLWDIVGGRQLKQLITYDATMYSIAVHPQGALIAAAGADRKVHLLDMITGTERQAMTGHSDYLHSVTFSPDGARLMSYGYAGQLKYWNTADGKLLHENRLGRIGNTAQFSPSGKRIVVASGDGTASIVPSGF
ncbi:MAG: hypothetical protein WKF77_07690 [Planctomycetaceae bacterium]